MRRTMRSLFWSCFLIALGGVLIANAAFGTDIPVFRLFLGILVIWWGVSVILGGFRSREAIAAEAAEKIERKTARIREKIERKMRRRR